MGWKWELGDFAQMVNDAVNAKTQELSDRLLSLASEAQNDAMIETDPSKKAFLKGKADAFTEVHDAVRPHPQK